MSQLLNPDQLESFLAKFSPSARALSLATREAVLKVFPDAIETAEGKELGYGFDRGYKGLVFAISMKKNGVNLGVFGGATLDDPAHLLRGTGRVHRHIEILDLDVLRGSAFAALLSRALAVRRA